MSFVCSSCGKNNEGKVFPKHLCQSCYNYFRHGGTVNELPQPGEIKRDHRGFVVCHICGKAYVRLGSHAKESHGMTIAEYKEEFGLCNNCNTTESGYSSTMKAHAYKNKMPERLTESGKGTRIKAGEKHMRLGKKVRLQEVLEKRARNIKNYAQSC